MKGPRQREASQPATDPISMLPVEKGENFIWNEKFVNTGFSPFSAIDLKLGSVAGWEASRWRGPFIVLKKAWIMYLFSGDFRTDENTALAAQQTLWVREHNRIVDLLRPLKPHWKAEKLFQEARRINIAQYQHILFKEFLPILIGLLVSLSMQLTSTSISQIT